MNPKETQELDRPSKDPFAEIVDEALASVDILSRIVHDGQPHSINQETPIIAKANILAAHNAEILAVLRELKAPYTETELRYAERHGTNAVDRRRYDQLIGRYEKNE